MSINKSKVVIWGHQLEQGHTHSFIHAAFYKGFKHLGFEVQWLDNAQSDRFNWSDQQNYLFLTEGQVDGKIPILKNAKYILHNCNLDKYQPVISNTLNIQVYTKLAKIKQEERKLEYLGQPCHWYQPSPVLNDPQHGIDNRTLYFTWATNLLPDEFFEPDISLVSDKVYWVGSICDGFHGNDKQIAAFIQGCKAQGVGFVHLKVPEGLQSSKAIRYSAIAPALQGQWQVDWEYIPCRVFKNISYGRIPATNNPGVYELFNQQLPFTQDCTMMYEVNREYENKLITTKHMTDLQQQVKQNHTYLNRIKTIMELI